MSSNYPGINATFHLEKVEEILATMTVTMTVKQWRHIASKLSTDGYQEWPLRSAIMDLVRQADMTIFGAKE